MKQRKYNKNSLTRLLILSVMLCPLMITYSCLPTRFLEEEESLLKKNNVVFVDKDNLTEGSELKYELARFYIQKPNGKLLNLFPREWYYLRNSDPGDTSWYKNWVREDVGEVPAIFDESKSDLTSENMRLYLKNVKGYFNASVDYNSSTANKHTQVEYIVTLGNRYKINSIEYLSKDKTLLREVLDIQRESILSAGAYIDADVFNKEKNQITQSLQNRGYANFLNNYINIKADSTKAEQALDFYVEILTPPNRLNHQKYTIGDVNIFTDYHSAQDTSELDKENIFGKYFFKESEAFILKPSALDKMIFMKKGEVYNRVNRYKTNRKLSSLGTYKFVNLAPYSNNDQDSILNYNIALSPFAKKWVLDYGADIFYSTINSTTGRKLIGFSIGGNLVNRNLFGGAEKNTLSTELGVEFELSKPVRTNTLTLRLQDNVEFPRYINTFSSINLLNKVGLLKDETLGKIKEESLTNIGGGYSFQKVINWYDISSFNLSYGYTYKPNNNHKIDFRQIGFNLNRYDLKDDFPTTSPLLERSFQNNLFTGFLFRELAYFRKWTSGRFDKNAYTFLGSFETSGLETWGLNKLYNVVSSSNDNWQIKDLDFSNFVRLQLDGRYYRQITQGSSFASRIYAGIAIPYADDQVTPYIKQLYVGGPNSIRAWQSRELGPGGFSDLLIIPVENELFYQAGDIKLELNIEYRFDVIWYLEGAFFIDAGNIWSLREDISRANAKISTSFYEQIAVGAGWGLRFDFTYFVIRLDFGYKMRNPYSYPEPVSKGPWVFDFSGFGNANIAVNYPF